MTERYWITGVQIGMLIALVGRKNDECVKILREIEKRQFIGNMPFPYEDYGIKIRKI